jgi:hypothetical protein
VVRVGGNTTDTLGQTVDRSVASATWTTPTAATHTLFGGITLIPGRTYTNVNFHYTTAAATITIYYVSLIRLSDRRGARHISQRDSGVGCGACDEDDRVVDSVRLDGEHPGVCGDRSRLDDGCGDRRRPGSGGGGQLRQGADPDRHHNHPDDDADYGHGSSADRGAAAGRLLLADLS